MIVEYIDAHREELGVDPICRVLTEQAGVQIAPSTYYAAKQQGVVSAAISTTPTTPTPCLTCGWPTAVSTACASCGTLSKAQVTAGAATGWRG